VCRWRRGWRIVTLVIEEENQDGGVVGSNDAGAVGVVGCEKRRGDDTGIFGGTVVVGGRRMGRIEHVGHARRRQWRWVGAEWELWAQQGEAVRLDPRVRWEAGVAKRSWGLRGWARRLGVGKRHSEGERGLW